MLLERIYYNKIIEYLIGSQSSIMMKLTLMAAAFAVSMSNAFIRTEGFELLEDGVTPKPGGFQVLLDVPSMSSLMQYAGLFVPYYALRGKEFELGINMAAGPLEFVLNNATITNAIIPKAGMSFKNNTDHIVISATGNTFNLDVDGHVKGSLGIIDIEADI